MDSHITEVLNVTREASWLPWAVQYFFLIGLSYASFMLTLPYFVFGRAHLERLGRLSLLAALACGVAAPVALLADLHGPGRFYHFYLYFQPRSWMAWGSFFIPLYLGGLLLYALTVPAVGLVPALTVWLVGQVFVAALFVLGLALGAALSSYPVLSKNLRGLAMLLFILVVGGGVAAQSWWLPFDQSTWGPLLGWSLLSARLLLGIGYAFVLATPLLLFAQWRIADVRHRDVTVGDAE